MVTSANAVPLYTDRNGDIFKWAAPSVTYAFPTSADFHADGYDGLLNEDDTYEPIYPGAHAVFARAFAHYGEIADISFEEIDPEDGADIDVAASEARGVAWAYFPGTGLQAFGDIWLNVNGEASELFAPLANPPAAYDGLYFYNTLLHEMGHAIGLRHGHETTNGKIPLAASVDGMEYSLMTYRSYVGDTSVGFLENRFDSFSATLMMLDIAALHALYGANFETAAEDTTYHFNPQSGQVLRDDVVLINPAENTLFFTIWDGNGVDTLDFSDYTTDLDINLAPGEGSDLDVGGDLQRAQLSATNDQPDVFAPFHFYTSLLPDDDDRALLENAKGGSGDDMLRGNAADNVFWGGFGADTYEGFGGADMAAGTVDELAGDRFADFSELDRVEILDYSGPVSLIANDIGLELAFEGGALALDGMAASSLFEITAHAGSTHVQIAGSGATLLTDASERFITTDLAQNSVFAGAGDDVVATAEGADTVSGGDGSDVILTGGGADILIGGKSSDELTGGTGADIFAFDISDYDTAGTIVDFVTDFEIGLDRLELSGFGFTDLSSIDFISLDAGDAIDLGGGGFIVLEGIQESDLGVDDIVTSEFARSFQLASVMMRHELTDANDRFVTTDDGPNEILGFAGQDALIGAGGADILRGGDDDDVIFGGAGDDRLIGGQGSDQLSGREGADSFEFTAGEETGFAFEFITDLDSTDRVVLDGFGYTDEAELSFDIVATGEVALALSDTRFIVFEGITEISTLAGAFDFA